jgi:hypothetical protein
MLFLVRSVSNTGRAAEASTKFTKSACETPSVPFRNKNAREAFQLFRRLSTRAGGQIQIVQFVHADQFDTVADAVAQTGSATSAMLTRPVKLIPRKRANSTASIRAVAAGATRREVGGGSAGLDRCADANGYPAWAETPTGKR